jgi:hypothetical protein
MIYGCNHRHKPNGGALWKSADVVRMRSKSSFGAREGCNRGLPGGTPLGGTLRILYGTFVRPWPVRTLFPPNARAGVHTHMLCGLWTL